MKPILFSGPMVRAILEGRKTQTRRLNGLPQDADDIRPDEALPEWEVWKDGEQHSNILCPYGDVGDVLWVRETWCHYQTVSQTSCEPFGPMSDGLAGYKADGYASIEDFKNSILDQGDFECVLVNRDRWQPSIHMPKWACRLYLTIKDIRVERLQDISVEDALAEGIDHSTLNDPRVEYQWLWDSINNKPGRSWGDNPWVWVLFFERVEK